MHAFAVSAGMALMAVSAIAVPTISEASFPALFTSTVYATSAMTVTNCGLSVSCESPSTTVITVTSPISTTVCPVSEASGVSIVVPSSALFSGVTAEPAASSPAESSPGVPSFYLASSDTVPNVSIVYSAEVSSSSSNIASSVQAVSSAEVSTLSSTSAPAINTPYRASNAVSQISSAPTDITVNPASTELSQSVSSRIGPPAYSVPNSASASSSASSKGSVAANPEASSLTAPSPYGQPSSSASSSSSSSTSSEETIEIQTLVLSRTMTRTVGPANSSINIMSIASAPGYSAPTSAVTANPNASSNATASGTQAQPSVFLGGASSPKKITLSTVLVGLFMAAMI